MKCRLCDGTAVAEVRQHRMALCDRCYPDWFAEYTDRTIRKFRMCSTDERILVAVSGGKDSLALWDVMCRLGYRVDGMIVELGIGDDGEAAAPGEGYSARSTEFAVGLAEELGRPLWRVDLRRLLGRTVPELPRGQRPVCSACGLTKRYFMNRVAFEGGYDCVATGHNLDDEVATLFGNLLRWQEGYLATQGPVGRQRGRRLMRKIKPFCYFSERETTLYAMIRGIPYVREDCPNAAGAPSIDYKEMFNRLETDARGTKRRFYDGFLKNRDRFREEEEPALGACERCGMPSSIDLCSFCRMVGDAPIHESGALERLRPAGATAGPTGAGGDDPVESHGRKVTDHRASVTVSATGLPGR